MSFVTNNSPALKQHLTRLLNSFEQLLKRKLLETKPQTLVEQINNAPFVLLSHDTQADPVFNFANKKGLTLFEYNWEEFTSTPSRFSAEAFNREERQRLLTLVNKQGYIDHYSGVRISKSGKRFLINNAIVWNIYDENGDYYGQAAVFDNWQYLKPLTFPG